MTLWIRSQDKDQLLLINTLALAEDKLGLILGYGIDSKIKSSLGVYKTRNRAIEVLNEIQNIINAKTIIKFNSFIPDEQLNKIKETIATNSIIELPNYEIKELAGVIVYEMPEE